MLQVELIAQDRLIETPCLQQRWLDMHPWTVGASRNGGFVPRRVFASFRHERNLGAGDTAGVDVHAGPRRRPGRLPTWRHRRHPPHTIEGLGRRCDGACVEVGRQASGRDLVLPRRAPHGRELTRRPPSAGKLRSPACLIGTRCARRAARRLRSTPAASTPTRRCIGARELRVMARSSIWDGEQPRSALCCRDVCNADLVVVVFKLWARIFHDPEHASAPISAPR